MANSQILARLPLKGATSIGGTSSYAGMVPVLNGGGTLDSSFGGGSGSGTHIFLVSDQTARLALSAAIGDSAKESTTGRVYQLQSLPASTNGNWVQISDLTVILDDLTDVIIASPLNDQVLTYETSSTSWKNKVAKQNNVYLPTVTSQVDLKAVPTVAYNTGQIVSFTNVENDAVVDLWILLPGLNSADDSLDWIVVPTDYNITTNDKIWLNFVTVDLGADGYATEFKGRALQGVGGLGFSSPVVINLAGSALVQRNDTTPSTGTTLQPIDYRITGSGGITLKLNKFVGDNTTVFASNAKVRIINDSTGTVTINNFSNTLVATLKRADDVTFTALTTPNIWRANWNVPQLVFGAGQSIRRKADDTGYEVYTPGAGSGTSTATYVVTNQAARLALSGINVGDICKETTTGEVYILRTAPSSVNGNWEQISDLTISIQGLTDVQIASLQNGQVLTYNGSSTKWENKAIGLNPKFLGTTGLGYFSANATVGIVTPYQIYVIINTDGEAITQFWQFTDTDSTPVTGKIIRPPDYNAGTNPFSWVLLFSCGTNDEFSPNSLQLGGQDGNDWGAITLDPTQGIINSGQLNIQIGGGAYSYPVTYTQSHVTAIPPTEINQIIRYTGTAIKTFTLPEIALQVPINNGKVRPGAELHFINESAYDVTIQNHVTAPVATVRSGDYMTFRAKAVSGTWMYSTIFNNVDMPPGFSIRRKADNTGFESYDPAISNFALNKIQSFETVIVPTDRSLITYHHLDIEGTLTIQPGGFCVIL